MTVDLHEISFSVKCNTLSSAVFVLTEYLALCVENLVEGVLPLENILEG